MTYTLQSVTYSDLSPIEYSAKIAQFGHGRIEALVLAFSGTMPEGSSGNKHARFMSFITGQFVVLTLPDCVVFDLRHLAYSFGDSLLALPHAAQTELKGIPCVFVASDKCRTRLRTLLASPSHDTSEFLFDDLEVALEKAHQLGAQYDEQDR